jgi:hypothetical protein
MNPPVYVDFGSGNRCLGIRTVKRKFLPNEFVFAPLGARPSARTPHEFRVDGQTTLLEFPVLGAFLSAQT